MSGFFMDGLLQAASTNVPVLPALWVTQFWQSLGWSVVLAWLAVMLVRRFSPRWAVHAGVALVMAVWTWLPGPCSPDYWLALAFQTPSVLTVLLCGLVLWQTLGRRAAGAGQDGVRTVEWRVLVWAGVLLGWALLLDTFALLPVQLYAWGFNPLVVALVAVLVLLPWLASSHVPRARAMDWMPLIAVLLFVATRLPTGNVWDAVLDPWLWLVLQGLMLRTVFKRY
jgi:peptidoglycan/LPS O-acetylase OafA/YrhL